MEKLYFEIPSIARKEDAIDYIREFHEYQSDINGTGGMDRFIDNYEGWLHETLRFDNCGDGVACGSLRRGAKAACLARADADDEAVGLQLVDGVCCRQGGP